MTRARSQKEKLSKRLSDGRESELQEHPGLGGSRNVHEWYNTTVWASMTGGCTSGGMLTLGFGNMLFLTRMRYRGEQRSWYQSIVPGDIMRRLIAWSYELTLGWRNEIWRPFTDSLIGHSTRASPRSPPRKECNLRPVLITWRTWPDCVQQPGFGSKVRRRGQCAFQG